MEPIPYFVFPRLTMISLFIMSSLVCLLLLILLLLLLSMVAARFGSLDGNIVLLDWWGSVEWGG